MLSFAHSFTHEIGWLALGVFLLGAVLEPYDRDLARPVLVAAWVLFAVFWFSLIDYYAFQQKSVIEGVGSVAAVPLSLYVGTLLARGRDSLFVLSRAIAVMGIVYVPFVTIEELRRPLIEIVTDQTRFGTGLLGLEPDVVEGMTLADGTEIGKKSYPYESTFLWWDGDHAITYTIRIACTGIGSMAIVAGLVGAVRAPAARKARALAVSIPIIWLLNIVRNVFINTTFGTQSLHVFPDPVMALFGLSDPRFVSFILADRVIAQSLSVLALVGITWLVVREVPEVLTVLEDAIYLLTGREYDLQAALDVDRTGEEAAESTA